MASAVCRWRRRSIIYSHQETDNEWQLHSHLLRASRHGRVPRALQPCDERRRAGFISGQLPVAQDGTVLHDATFEVQAQQVLANVAAALQGAGSSIGQLLQVRVYITDMALWPAFNAIYAQWAGVARPARAVVPVPVLHYGCALEVEATALG